MSKLYIPVLPNAQATTEDSEIRARIQQSGLLQQGGTATQKISAENIDLLLSGNWQYGTTISKKLKTELQSLGESAYEGLPYYDPTTDIDHRGYYELRQVDVSPPQKDIESMYEYTAALTFTGTHETHWRAVETNVETIDTGLATGSGGLIGIPATASKVRWFDTADGKESATAASTVAGEFGNVELYDPTQPTFDNPTLIYEVPFGDESGTDVRVWDDLRKDKKLRSGGDAYNTGDYGIGAYGQPITVTQWVHAYHTAFEFDGNPVVDNGLLRITFDEDAGNIEFEEYIGLQWEDSTPDQTDYDLLDADLERIGPTSVDVFAEFEKTDGTIDTAILSIQRGLSNVVVREPENETLATDLEFMLDPIASDQTTDAQPEQSLKARQGVK